MMIGLKKFRDDAMDEEGHRTKRIKVTDSMPTEIIVQYLTTQAEQGNLYKNRQSDSNSKRLPPSNRSTAEGRNLIKDFDIDLSNTPTNPSYMAIWITELIHRVESGESESPEISIENYTSQKSSALNPVGTQDYDDHNDHSLASFPLEQEKTSAAATYTRKQGSRRSNLQQSSGYQGDNLRSRVNVLANKFLGKKHFPKRAAHDRSKEKRRGKRANKNHIEADSSALQISTNLNTSFLSKVGAKISEDTRAACTLLLNALPGVCDGDPCINREAAALLQSKLAAVDTDQTPFVEALFMIGASSELTAVIDKAMLNFYEKGQGSDQPIISSDGEGSSDPQGKRFDSMEIKENSHSVARSEHVQDDHRPDNIVRDLDAATDILNDLAAGISNSYVTPYSDQSQPDGRRAATTTRREEISKDKKANRSISGAVPGRSQVDELLKLAAGGSDSDEEDRNNTARCPDDCSINNQASQAAILQLDGDVTATVDRIAKEMMEDINGNSPPRAGDQDRSTFGTWQTDRYGSDIAKKKAAALKRLITRTGVPINTIIPAARSQATSRLYAHLSSRAMRFPTSGSGIDPRHASIYGNTAQMTQRMLAQPGAPIQLSHKIPIIPSWNGKSQQYRGRNAEEAKKIEEFGYPPRPSVILGRKRKFR